MPTLHTVPSRSSPFHTPRHPLTFLCTRLAHKHGIFTTLHLFHKPVQPTTSVLPPSTPPHPPLQLQQEASRSVCSGHSGQELKCSKEEPGASAPRLQERTALASAAAAPPARSRGASERSSRCSEPSRASLARLLPKFARGRRRGWATERGAQPPPPLPSPSWTWSLERRRAHGAASFDQQRVRISPRRCCLGSAVPSSRLPERIRGKEQH